MNIEQIADAVSKEMLMHVAAMQPELVKWNREFLRRCISKLAEHDMNPVGFLNVANIEHLKRGVLQSNVRIKRNHERNTVPLYTETQLLAAQQRTAEACAKACESITKEYDMDGIYADFFANLIRNGEWRKYL